MICLTHPGKMGDLLFSLATARALCQKFDCQADFATSEYCRPLIPLLEYQPYINKVFVPDKYVIDNFGQGVQPWRMPVYEGDEYEHVFHLGISRWPDRNMVDFYGLQAGIEPQEYVIDVPPRPSDDFFDDKGITVETFLQGYALISCSPILSTDWYCRIIEVISEFKPVVQLGGPGERLLPGVVNTKYVNLLDTAALMRWANLYTGCTGPSTCMSMAFPNLKSVICLPEAGMDHRHNVRRDHVTYVIGQGLEDWIKAIR